MNSNEIMSTWLDQKKKLKEKFAKLMDNDDLLFDGKKEQILGELQIKLGKTKEEIEKILKEI